MIVSISVYSIPGSNPKVEVSPDIDEILSRIDDVKAVIVSKFEHFRRFRRKYVKEGDVFKVYNEKEQEIGSVSADTMKLWLNEVLNAIKEEKFLDISMIC